MHNIYVFILAIAEPNRTEPYRTTLSSTHFHWQRRQSSRKTVIVVVVVVDLKKDHKIILLYLTKNASSMENWRHGNVAVRCRLHLYMYVQTIYACKHACMHRVLYLNDRAMVYSCQLVFVCIIWMLQLRLKSEKSFICCRCSLCSYTTKSTSYGYPTIEPSSLPVS